MVAVSCGWQYFPARKGTVSGIIISGFGLSAFFFSFAVPSLFNPNNYDISDPRYGDGTYYFREISDRAMPGLRWLLLMQLISFTIGILLVRKPG